jgi:hypothetical protein
VKCYFNVIPWWWSHKGSRHVGVFKAMLKCKVSGNNIVHFVGLSIVNFSLVFGVLHKFLFFEENCPWWESYVSNIKYLSSQDLYLSLEQNPGTCVLDKVNVKYFVCLQMWHKSPNNIPVNIQFISSISRWIIVQLIFYFCATIYSIWVF